jgi:hypothetical protein
MFDAGSFTDFKIVTNLSLCLALFLLTVFEENGKIAVESLKD